MFALPDWLLFNVVPFSNLTLPPTTTTTTTSPPPPRDGGNMVTDQKLKVNPGARMQELNLVALAPTNAAEFRHPLTLLRLAHFVRDATKVGALGGGGDGG